MKNFIFKSKKKIGLEIHVTLNTLRKIFNLNQSFNEKEEFSNNKNIEAWELGYLGTLPIINTQVIEFAIKLCLSLNSKISKKINFDRKVYSYFDLPKGFQITQQNNPIGSNGYLPILFGGKIQNIPIKRIQIEEDTAKSFYHKEEITLDFNRSGNPLIEIVTDPIFDDIEFLLIFIKQLQNLLRNLDISEAKMEKGQFRIDLNFSFIFNDSYQTPRYEIKNLNSLKNLRVALDHEFEKHSQIFKESKNKEFSLKSETLGFDEFLQKTFVQRTKSDYFYLPEVNIPNITISDKEIEKIKLQISTFPWTKNSKNKKIVFENPFFCNFFNLLEIKKNDYKEDFDNLCFFLSNYLLALIKKSDYRKLLLFIDKNFDIFWKIFILSKEKSISRVILNLLIVEYFETQDNHNEILKKIENLTSAKKESIPSDVLEKELFTIIKNSSLSFKILSHPHKLLSFLLGELKKKFPGKDINIREVQDFSTGESRKFLNK